MNHLIVRADANTQIGTGHLMRSLALAQAWQARGGAVTFLTNCESKALRQRIAAEQFTLVRIEHSHSHSSDLEKTVSVISGIKSDVESGAVWLVLDGYHFDSDYQQAIRAAGHDLLVIDDTSHLKVYHANVLLNQDINAEQLDYSCDPDTLKLLGTQYALLRSEFLKWQGWKRQITDVARKVLVTLGGSDPDNVTSKVIDGLKYIDTPMMEVKIVVGGANRYQEELRQAAKDLHHETELLTATDQMPELMAWADVAISAAGSTCWELAFMGLPGLLIVLADNQRLIAEGLDESNAAIYVGEGGDIQPTSLARRLRELLEDSGRRERMSEEGRKLVDGKGPARVFAALMFASAGKPLNRWQLRVRPATADDSPLLWNWANKPSVRSNSINQESITWESHVRWYEQRLNSPDTRFWILEAAGVPVGQIRYDKDSKDETAEISFSVAEEARGLGYGVELIVRTLDMAKSELNVRKIEAISFVDNVASYRAFLRAGFMNEGTTTVAGHSCYKLSWPNEEETEEP